MFIDTGMPLDNFYTKKKPRFWSWLTTRISETGKTVQ